LSAVFSFSPRVDFFVQFVILKNLLKEVWLMVTFPETMGGCEVRIDGKLLGHLTKGRSKLFISTTIRNFIGVSPEDLRKIADKAEEMIKEAVAH